MGQLVRQRRCWGRLAVLACAGLACAGDWLPPVGGLPSLPLANELVRVVSTNPRGPYLETTLLTGDGSIGLYVPDLPECRALLEPGAQLRFQSLGPLGEIEAAGRCQPIGSASLVRLRDGQPRPTRARALPRATARFARVYEDSEVQLARGEFPLANLVGFLGGDLIAVVPNSPICRAALDRGEAFLTYQYNGAPVFQLSAGAGNCDVLGLAQPPGDGTPNLK